MDSSWKQRLVYVFVEGQLIAKDHELGLLGFVMERGGEHCETLKIQDIRRHGKTWPRPLQTALRSTVQTNPATQELSQSPHFTLSCPRRITLEPKAAFGCWSFR